MDLQYVPMSVVVTSGFAICSYICCSYFWICAFFHSDIMIHFDFNSDFYTPQSYSIFERYNKIRTLRQNYLWHASSVRPLPACFWIVFIQGFQFMLACQNLLLKREVASGMLLKNIFARANERKNYLSWAGFWTIRSAGNFEEFGSWITYCTITAINTDE